MAFTPKLEILRELRDAAGLTQDDMARLCSLTGKKRRQTAGAWERGDITPSRSRRTRFMRYLWDGLKLSKEPARFEEVWEMLMGAWEWEAISDSEWVDLTTLSRPERPNATQQKLEQMEAKLSQLQHALSKQVVTSEAPLAPGQRQAFDATLYTRPGVIKGPDRLFGWDALLAAAYRPLIQGKQLLLTGFAGTGKSALAATLAERWLLEGRGAILWLVAENGDLEVILEAMTTPFDRQAQLAQRRGEAKLNFVRNLLESELVGLVVLDDVAQVSILGRIQKSIPAGTALLVTSTYDAAHFDASHKVADLAGEAALALLADHAQNERYSEESYREEPAGAALCERLSYHALALVIAGGWLKQSRRPAADLLRRLNSGNLTAITIEMPLAAAQPGHSSVALLLAATLNSLSGPACRLFGVWGLLAYPQATSEFLIFFAGSSLNDSNFDDASLDDASLDEVENALDELVAWNFAEREGSNRYRLHRIIHDFARQERRVAGQGAAAEELGLAGGEPLQTGKIVGRYLAAYATDFVSLQHNFANVLAMAVAVDDVTALSVVAPLVVHGFLDVYGYRQAVVALLDRAVACLRAMGEAGVLSQEQATLFHYVLSKRGNAAFDHGDYAAAMAAYGAALEVAPNEGRRIRLLALVGKALAFGGDDEAAQGYFSQAQEEIVEEESLRSFVLEQEAHVAGFKGDHQTAWRVASEQVAINRQLLQSAAEPAAVAEHGDALFHSLINLGTAQLRSGRGTWAQSLAIHEEAMALAESSGRAEWKAHALWALAEDYHMLEDRARAEECLAEAYMLYREQEKRRDLHELVAFARLHGYRLP